MYVCFHMWNCSTGYLEHHIFHDHYKISLCVMYIELCRSISIIIINGDMRYTDVAIPDLSLNCTSFGSM